MLTYMYACKISTVGSREGMKTHCGMKEDEGKKRTQTWSQKSFHQPRNCIFGQLGMSKPGYLISEMQSASLHCTTEMYPEPLGQEVNQQAEFKAQSILYTPQDPAVVPEETPHYLRKECEEPVQVMKPFDKED